MGNASLARKPPQVAPRPAVTITTTPPPTTIDAVTVELKTPPPPPLLTPVLAGAPPSRAHTPGTPIEGLQPAGGTGAAGGAGGAGAGVGGAPGDKDRDKESGEGHWVLPPELRGFRLQDYYDVPDKEMGRGHYGIVRKGVRRTDGARVAVKTIPKRRLVYIDMLKNEIGLLRALDDANIIKLYDTYEDEKQLHIVFELCSGGELFDSIADQNFRFTERQASRLVRKMLYAVKYCHDRNIVHRDLKPENMLLTEPGVESELKVGVGAGCGDCRILFWRCQWVGGVMRGYK